MKMFHSDRLKERRMTKGISLSAVALLAGLSIAGAQRVPADGHNDQAKPAQNGAEEPGSRAAAPADINVFVNGKLVVPGAPEDSQTVPSTVSERNARLDATPIMALPLGLSHEQKHRVAESVAKSDAPVSEISAKPADILPATTPVSEFAADVKAQVPMLSDVRFIRTKDKILLVRAPNMVVTGEISTN
jgi:hypothetical protein